jgi:hypothetical protein
MIDLCLLRAGRDGFAAEKGPTGQKGQVSQLGGVPDVEQPKDGIYDLAFSLRLALPLSTVA